VSAAVAAKLVLGEGQSFPVLLDKESVFHLVGAPAGAPPSIAAEAGGICTVMPAATEIVFYEDIGIPIYPGEYPYPYPNGPLAMHYRFPVEKKHKKTGVWFTGLKTVMHDLAKARRLAKAEAKKRYEKREEAAKRKLPEQVGIAEHAQRICDALTKMGIGFYGFLDEALRAAEMRADYWPVRPPALDRIVEDAGKIAAAQRPQKPAKANDVLAKYVRALDRLLAKNRMSEVGYRIKTAFLKHFAKRFGNRFFHTITAEELTAWLGTLTEIEYKTAKARRSTINLLFNFARDTAEALPLGPTAAKGIKLDPKNYKRSTARAADEAIEFYTWEEAAKIIRTAWGNPKWRPWVPVIVLRLFAGFHFAEVVRMRYSNLRPAENKIVARGDVTEDHKPRQVLMSPANFSLLLPFWRAANEKGELENPILHVMEPGVPAKKDYHKYQVRFNNMLKRLLIKAGVTYKKNGMRHAFATNTEHLTGSLEFTRKQMGSSIEMMLKFYVEIEMDHDKAVPYFQIGDPALGSFVNQSNWIPKHIYRTPEELAEEARQVEEQIEIAERVACKTRYGSGRSN
jgi:hypothetical protein